MAEPGSLVRSRRQARDDVSRLRFQARWYLGLGLLWLVLAVGSWAVGDVSGWARWGWPALALGNLGVGYASSRGVRRERARLAALVGVDLRPPTEAALSRLVAAALKGTAADEVTPPVSPGEAWTPERVEWLRAFHRDRRRGLDGPHREATWAVVEVTVDESGDERVVGGVRLRHAGDPGVLEVGMWLVREARGRGVGRQALGLLLDRAREAGATSLRAATTDGNAAAVALLRSLGFDTEVDGGRVRAELTLTR